MGFDDLTDKHKVYKVETVGDAYIAGQAGWPLTQQNSPISVLFFALDMVIAVNQWSRKRREDVRCRVGVHFGKCIGGIVGQEMQRYHLFGDMMTKLENLESTATEGGVQTSRDCYEEVQMQMSTEGINRSALRFEPRAPPNVLTLLTSKGEVVDWADAGGCPTYLVKKTTSAEDYAQLLRGNSVL